MMSFLKRQQPEIVTAPTVGVERAAVILGVSEPALRKRVQRDTDLPEPIDRSPLKWRTADIYRYVLDHVAPAKRPGIPVQFWPRPSAPARLAAVEESYGDVRLVFQPDHGLGTITLRYHSLYGPTVDRRDDRRWQPGDVVATSSGDVICDPVWQVSGDHGLFVDVRVAGTADRRPDYETTTTQLAHALGRRVPVLPAPLVNSGALSRWNPDSADPVKAAVAAQDRADDLWRYRGALPASSLARAAVEQHWQQAHDDALETAWNQVELLSTFPDVVVPAIPSEPLPAEPFVAQIDWTLALTEAVGVSADTVRLAEVIGFGDAYREVVSIDRGHMSEAQKQFTDQFDKIADDDASLAHLMLMRHFGGVFGAKDIKLLRHKRLPLVAAIRGKEFSFCLPDTFLAGGLEEIDLSDPSVPLYRGDLAEWVPLPGAFGGYSAGYQGGGPSHLTAVVKHLLDGGRAGDPDQRWVTDGSRSNVFAFAGRAGLYSRRDIEALFA